ncbi:MAG: hypothetical protein E3J52_03265 [Promethearchaeota archaeon]|nr:MAG: hypothetical protein E3J52_03265 [Candidatus Lokiarchaeota archaeon]
MVEDNNIYPDMESKIESELFALIKFITNLNKKYQKGIVNDNFFRKALKNAMNNLLKLNFTLKEISIQLPDLLNKMKISQEYRSAIDIINRVSSLDLSNNKSPEHHTFLELPGITSEITTSFITLMDALNLDGLKKQDLIFNLFDELNNNLGNFPGLDDILYKVKSIHKNSLNHIDTLMSDVKLKNKIIDDLYQVFKEFQNKLNLKSKQK